MHMKSNKLWVLGPNTEAMRTVEALLVACGEDVAYATYSGHRVDKDRQYKADGISVKSNALIYAVGCSGTFLRGRSIASIDPHKVGNPGFGLPPKHYLEGSYLGQVAELLTKLGHFTTIRGLMMTNFGASQASRDRFLFSAAADYSLEAALAGKCSGIDPTRFSLWKISNHIG